MSNCKFPDSFSVCSRISARLRQVANESDFSAQAGSAAWKEAEAEFEKRLPALTAPAPASVAKPKPQPPVPFEDRAPLPLLSYTPCFHGMYDASICAHCLGTAGASAQEIADLLVDDGPQAPEVAELHFGDEQAPIEAGVDDPEPEEESEIAEEAAEAEVEEGDEQ